MEADTLIEYQKHLAAFLSISLIVTMFWTIAFVLNFIREDRGLKYFLFLLVPLLGYLMFSIDDSILSWFVKKDIINVASVYLFATKPLNIIVSVLISFLISFLFGYYGAFECGKKRFILPAAISFFMGAYIFYCGFAVWVE